MVKHSTLSFFISLIIFLAFDATPVVAQKSKPLFRSQLIDSVDHALDISNWMSQVYGFLPAASIITEPAVGYGIAGGIIHLTKKNKPSYNGGKIPPDVSIIGGAYTQNNTWAAVLIHKGYWKQDRIRFSGVAGYLSPNLAVYFEGPQNETAKFGFNLKGPIFIPSVSFRIKDSKSLLGVKYVFMKNTVSFDVPIEEVPVKPQDQESTLSGLGVLYTFDSRDNTFTPNKGTYSNVSVLGYNEYIGSTQDYIRIDSYIVAFKPIGNKLIIGGRFDYRAAFQEPPFYSLPYVPLRGVPAFRYQGRQVTVLETEERWDITKRWSLVGFAGLGKGFEKLESFDQQDWAYSMGGGIRYLLAKSFKLYSGLDVARGPEDWAFYIQFGHYWNGL